jgi:hypothetical protein
MELCPPRIILGKQNHRSSYNLCEKHGNMTDIELSKLPPEALGRTLVVLEQGFVQRHGKGPFARIATKKKQLAFGVTLGLRE